jgi:type 1 fimbria pilin
MYLTNRGREKPIVIAAIPRSFLRQIIFATVIVSFIAISSEARSACTFVNSQTAHIYTINIPTDTLARDVPIGTVLYTANLPAIPATGTYASCTSPGSWVKSVTGGTLVSSDPNTYASDIDGIGVRFFDGIGTGRGYFGPGASGTYPGTWNYNNTYYGVDIVRIASTGQGNTSGTVPSTMYATFTLDGLLVATINFLPFQVAVQTCTVTTPSINVEMPRTHVDNFPTVNSTYGDTTFNMGLSCNPGIKVAVTITDVTDPSNTSTTLSLGHGSTASGIGYQIVNNGVPIAFGPDSAAVNTQNQFVIVPMSVSGSYTIPLSGRFIRTGTIVPGSANAYATFTMSYQ